MLAAEIMLLFGGVALTLLVPAMRGSAGRSARRTSPMQELRPHQVYRLPPRPRSVFTVRARRIIRKLQPSTAVWSD